MYRWWYSSLKNDKRRRFVHIKVAIKIKYVSLYKKRSRNSAPFYHWLHLSTTLCIAQQNLSIGVNVVNRGSPSLIRIVLRISFGITTLPKSSILLTIPVAFIYSFLLKLQIVLLLSVTCGEIYRNIYFWNEICYNIYKVRFMGLKNYYY